MKKNTIEGFEAIQNLVTVVGGVDYWSETQRFNKNGSVAYNDEHLMCQNGRYIDSEYNCDKGVVVW